MKGIQEVLSKWAGGRQLNITGSKGLNRKAKDCVGIPLNVTGQTRGPCSHCSETIYHINKCAEKDHKLCHLKSLSITKRS